MLATIGIKASEGNNAKQRENKGEYYAEFIALITYSRTPSFMSGLQLRIWTELDDTWSDPVMRIGEQLLVLMVSCGLGDIKLKE